MPGPLFDNEGQAVPCPEALFLWKLAVADAFCYNRITGPP